MLTKDEIASIHEGIICRYTIDESREWAFENCELTDLTNEGSLFGFTEPLVFTTGLYVDLVWHYCIGTNTKESDRLGAVLLAIRDQMADSRKHPSGRQYFRLSTCDADGTFYQLPVIAHTGDKGITVMNMPQE